MNRKLVPWLRAEHRFARAGLGCNTLIDQLTVVARPRGTTNRALIASDATDEVFSSGMRRARLVGDYYGDRIAEPALHRAGTWLVETGQRVSWGVGPDIALAIRYALRRGYLS
jgi:hypothetical protein